MITESKPPSIFTTPDTNPATIYEYRDAIYAVDILIVALVEFDFFTWLSKSPASFDEILAKFELTPRPADVMLTLFLARGFIERRDGTYRVTRLAEQFLVQGAPCFMGPYYAAMKDRPVCEDLLRVLRTGKAANWGSVQGAQEWTKAMESEEFAVRFTGAMDCRGVYLGPIMARALNCEGFHHVLDIAGGSGIYACCFAEIHPHLKATVFEKPPVDKVARTMIARRGFESRVAVAAGDMFKDELPGGCDIHLFSNVLHDWDVAEVKKLLASSYKALAPGGMLVIHDAHLNVEKTAPVLVAEYSVVLMHSTEGKCYSAGEMEGYLTETGFTTMTFTPTAIGRSVITARKSK
jgi:predicted O-methyltransferase YrrM